jgi:putative ABC transport system ATP-binding protein
LNISAISVSKTYTTRGVKALRTEALSNVSLDIPAGTVSLIHGPAGSGKSTLLALLAGMMEPTGGQILCDGVRLTGAADAYLARFRERTVGYVPQHPALLEDLTVIENVILPHALFAGRSVTDLRHRAFALLDRLGLREKSGVKTRELAGSDRKKLMTARALVKEPPFLFADDPVGGLDERSASAVMGLFSELQTRGSAVVIAANVPLLLKPAPSSYKLSEGRVVEYRRGKTR